MNSEMARWTISADRSSDRFPGVTSCSRRLRPGRGLYRLRLQTVTRMPMHCRGQSKAKRFTPCRASWRQETKRLGTPVSARQHVVSLRFVRQCRPEQLRSRQGRHIHHHQCDGASAVWHHGECDRPASQSRMTEGLRERTEEEIKRRNPRRVAPIVVWLASEESGEETGRVFEAVTESSRSPKAGMPARGSRPSSDGAYAESVPNADIWGQEIVS
jgi:hypothetical protein